MVGPATDRPSGEATYAPIVRPLLFPTWLVIGILLLLPVLLMVVYAFLTKEFRGGVEWKFTLAAFEQFFINRGLFGDEPAQIEWTYINIFWRSIWQAALATLLCLLMGFLFRIFLNNYLFLYDYKYEYIQIILYTILINL